MNQTAMTHDSTNTVRLEYRMGTPTHADDIRNNTTAVATTDDHAKAARQCYLSERSFRQHVEERSVTPHTGKQFPRDASHAEVSSTSRQRANEVPFMRL